MKKSLLVTLLFAMLGLCACVDDEYDLGNIDDSNIVIGDLITMPIGTTGEMKLGQFLNLDGLDEMSVSPDGSYFINYSGVYNVESDVTEIRDILAEFRMITPSDALVDGSVTNLTFKEYDVAISTSKNITSTMSTTIIRVDSVLMNTNASSQGQIAVSLNGFTFMDGEADLEINLVFPLGFEFTDASGKLKKGADGRFYLSDRIPLNQIVFGDVKLYNFKVNKLGAMKPAPAATLSAKLLVKSIVNGAVTQTPRLSIDFSVKNPMVDYLYGVVSVNESIQMSDINLAGLWDMFGADAVIRFFDPRILIHAKSNRGVDLSSDIKIIAEDANGQTIPNTVIAVLSDIPGKAVPASADILKNTWIGKYAPPVTSNYEFIQKDINSILSKKAAKMQVKVDITNALTTTRPNMFLPFKPTMMVDYKIQIPFQPSGDFKITMRDTLKEVFSGDIVNLVFSGGSAEIFGDATNTIPLDIELSLIPLTKENQPVGIQSNKVILKGSVNSLPTIGTISFKISESDMPKMKLARHLLLEAVAVSNQELEGKHLNKDHSISMKLKLRKTGGINI